MTAWKLKATPNSLPEKNFSIGAIRKFESNEFPVNDSAIFGRDQACCDYALPWKHISRQHTSIQVVDDGLSIKDLGSSNGTYLNGVKVDEAIARPGDIIGFDKIILKVVGPEGSEDEAISQALAPSDDENHTVIRAAGKKAPKHTAQPQPQAPTLKSLTSQTGSNGKTLNFSVTVSDQTLQTMKGVIIGLGIAAGVLAAIALF